MKFTEEQVERYARHIILPQVGGRGQRRLLESRVFVAGAGGLGSPIILYLAAAGVGTIVVADDDTVSLSNLQRQVLHSQDGLGTPKVDSAAGRVAGLNPDVRLIPLRERIAQEGVAAMIAGADVVLDGSDNFETRYLLNDACHFARIPLVSGAILQFEGQVTVFPNDGGGDSPCYRCLFPEPPPPGAVPNCQEAGVLGAIAGIVGSIQAAEAIKVLLGIGEPLAGRLLLLDALAMKWRELRLRRDPACALCGAAPTITRIASIGPVDACGGRQGHG